MAIESTRVTAILLAAGRSVRFGGSKLAHPLAGEPLIHYAARTLGTISFARRIAVMGSVPIDISHFGFGVVQSPPDAPLSASIAAGVLAAAATGCDACLIALADMPLVPESHFRALLKAHETEVTATRFGGRKTVPAVFARGMFPALRRLHGDRGAASLLSDATGVPAELAWLEDIDTPQDLARLETRF